MRFYGLFFQNYCQDYAMQLSQIVDFSQNHFCGLVRKAAVGAILSGIFFSVPNVFGQNYYRSSQPYQTAHRSLPSYEYQSVAQVSSAITSAPDFREKYRAPDGTLINPKDLIEPPRMWMTYHFSYDNSYDSPTPKRETNQMLAENKNAENKNLAPNVPKRDADAGIPLLASPVPARTPALPSELPDTPAPEIMAQEERVIITPQDVRIQRVTTAPIHYRGIVK